jgi:sugar lactone lactonase YvrE
MALDFTENAGSLYIIDKNYSISRKVDQLTIPNGLVFSLDHRYMYHIDSTTRKVAAYQYDPVSGNIRWEKIAIQVPKENGAPDGMCIDEEGMLWIAQWGGFGVYRYNPLTGELLTKIDVPVPNVSSCVFGGKNFDQLYITTAREHLSEKDLLEYPDSGSVYFASPGVKGMAGNKWNLNNI